MKKNIFILLSIFSFLLSSCGDFRDVTFLGIENVKVNKLSQDGIEVDVSAKIKNPNNIAFTIYKSDLDARLNGMNLGKAHLTKNIKIKSKSEQIYTFHLKSNFSKINLGELPNLLSILTKKNINVSLKGNLKVGKLFMKKSYPVDFTKSVPLSGF